MQTFHIRCDFCLGQLETESATALPAKWRRFFVLSRDQAIEMSAHEGSYYNYMKATRVETKLDVCNHCLGAAKLGDPVPVEEHAVAKSWFHRLTYGHLNFFKKKPEDVIQPEGPS